MALQTEIWLRHLVENLFSDNSAVSKSISLDAFANNKTVHIPNAGAAPAVKMNRSTFPASIVGRSDTDGNFSLQSFTTDPILVPNVDNIQLSYDKRQSVIGNSRNVLVDTIAEYVLGEWMKEKGVALPTTGSAVLGHLPTATGNRKAMTRADVLTVANKFNADNIPSDGRFLLLDAYMYAQLLQDLSEADKANFVASANAQQGTLGMLYGFNLMMRSRVGKANGAGAQQDWGVAGAAGDKAIALAWHRDSVCRAQGQHVLFAQEKDPTYYGDIISIEALAGGSKFRGDKKGIVTLVQEATT